MNIGCEAGERRQDFVLARGRERCWLEATVVGGDSPLSFTERRLDEQLRDIVADGARAALLARARGRQVRRLLAGTAADRAAARALARRARPARARDVGVRQAPRLRRLDRRRRRDSARRRARRDPADAPSSCRAGARLQPSTTCARCGARSRRRRPATASSTSPYLLAVLALGDHVRERDVEQALLGAGAHDHAVWHGPGGPCNTRLSGVLVARGLRSTDPFAAAAEAPTLWRNPWALLPLATALPWREAAGAARAGRRLDWPHGQSDADAVADQGLPLQREGALGARLQARPAPARRAAAAVRHAARRVADDAQAHPPGAETRRPRDRRLDRDRRRAGGALPRPAALPRRPGAARAGARAGGLLRRAARAVRCGASPGSSSRATRARSSRPPSRTPRRCCGRRSGPAPSPSRAP